MSDTPTQPAQEQPLQEISTEEFIKIWKGEYRHKLGYGRFYQKNRDGEELVVFDGFKVDDLKIKEHIELPHIELKNSKTGDFDIVSSKAGNFDIINSTTGNFWILDNSTTGNFWILDNSTTGSFSILNKSTTGFFNIVNSTTGSFDIVKSTMGSFDIVKSMTGYFWILGKSTIGSFSIRDNSTTSYFMIRDKSTMGDFDIDKSMTGYFDIVKSMTGSFSIRDNSTTGSFSIRDNSTTGSFSIRDNSTTDSFSIRDNSTTGYFDVVNSTTRYFDVVNSTTRYFDVVNSTMGDFVIVNSVIKSIKVNKSSIEDITIEDSVCVDRLILAYLTTSCKKLTVKSSAIGSLALQLDKAYQVTIKKEKGSSLLYNLDFKENIFPKGAYLHVSDTFINQMNLDSFLNHGTVIFNNVIRPVYTLVSLNRGHNADFFVKRLNACAVEIIELGVKTPSSVSITNSDLGNTQFIGCNLASFDEFKFKNSKMANVFLADAKLPKRKNITTVAPFTRVQQLAQQKLAMSQFKKVYESRGDIVKATELRAQELEAYRKYLVKSNVVKNSVELINLWLNKVTNVYGTSWLSAVLLTLTLNWFLFSCYCLNKGFFFDINGSTEIFFKLFSHSFGFLNPLHKSDFMNKVTEVHTNWSRWIDYISRIVMAYMVFQTVAAFRKFGRKSA